VASLDLLSGGRIELGLGAGAFWDAIEAMGVRRLQPAEAVQALEEAITVIREIWDVSRRGGVRVDGRHYRVHGAKRGPAPAHPVGIWVGAYKPRMLRLTGRLADGWLPSESYLQPGDLARAAAIIDRAATEAGRRPEDIRRLINLQQFDPDHLVELALEHGIDTFIAMADDPAQLQQFGETAAEVRERVTEARVARATDGRQDPAGAASRAAAGATPVTATPSTAAPGAEQQRPVVVGGPTGGEPGQGEYDRLGVRPTPDDGVRLRPEQPWDESSRPHRQPSGPEVAYSQRGRLVGQHLIDVHDHLRNELSTVRDVIDQVRKGAMEAGRARSVINDLTMRQNDWTLGAYCAAYCRTVAEHHSLEDRSIFPHLRKADHDLAAILDRLGAEHEVIHEVLEEVDRRLVNVIRTPGDYDELQEVVDLLTDTLLSHLAYEEQELVEPLARHGFYADQV
jgi:hemerythrin-like domain-containing protein